MTLKITAKLTKIEHPAAGSWWARRVPVPITLIMAAGLVIIGLTAVIVRKPTTPAVYTGPPAAPSARFTGIDVTTRGAWKTRYGGAGYALASDGGQPLAFGEIGSPVPNQSWKWVDDTEDVRALQKSRGAKRIAAAWFGWTPFTISLALKDAGMHRVAMYLIDWDATARVEKVEILDGVTGELLDSRESSDFSQGHYLTWTVTGHVVLRISPLSSANAVVSGIFVD